MTGRRRASVAALAALAAGVGALASATARADELEGGARAWLVGPECRIRAEGAIDCEPITRVRRLRGEEVAVQLVVDAGAAPVEVTIAPGGLARLEEQLFVPVRARSRGKDAREALPWAAAARPPDETILGEVADPLVRRRESSVVIPAGERRAWWLTVDDLAAGVEELAVLASPDGGPTLIVETIAATLPPPPVSFFAYFERDEPRLADASTERTGCAGDDVPPDTGVREMRRMLSRHGVLPVDTATDVAGLTTQLDDFVRTSGVVRRDLVVLGTYGTLGEPTDEAVARVEAMAAAVPAEVRDVVLYAIDEDCESSLGRRWRARLRRAGPAAQRVKVLVTCSDDPTRIGADVIVTTAERFRPARAAAARAQGKEVWVYNGRLPQAGPMALDAPPESMTWLGWIASRYDVRRWFLWNVNHWSDGNRGGKGPRDPYADPETFHNADGDAVLLDGLLVYPPHVATCPPAAPGEAAPTKAPLVRSARLARLRRGLDDAALLGLAASLDAAAAAEALDLVVPRALGDVTDREATPFGDARAIARARAMLHDVVAREAAISDEVAPAAAVLRATSEAGLVVLRAARMARSFTARRSDRALSTPEVEEVAAAASVAGCLVSVSIAAWRLGRRRRES